MNDVVKAILERRSIRKYAPDPVADADLRQIIEAGLYAPSSKNAQAWHILAIQNGDAIDRITREVKAAILRAGIEKYKAMAENPNYRVNFAGAPVFLIVSADPARTSCPAEDCSCVLQNMFLAAHSLGLGSCWVNQLGCVTDEPGFRALLDELGMPSTHKIYGCAAVGRPEGPTPKAPERKPDTFAIVK